MIGFGIRSIFGLFLTPMTLAQDWSRETFALALAIQNLLWGIGLPFAGALADRYGPRYVLAGGAVVYSIGVWGMAGREGRLLPAPHGRADRRNGRGAHRLLAGHGGHRQGGGAGPAVAGPRPGHRGGDRFGQVVFSPVGQGFISSFGWHQALLLLAAISLLIIPLALLVPNTTTAKGEASTDQTIGEALAEARSHRGYLLLTTGFFACGFHIAFITVHFPAFVQDLGFCRRRGRHLDRPDRHLQHPRLLRKRYLRPAMVPRRMVWPLSMP